MSDLEEVLMPVSSIRPNRLRGLLSRVLAISLLAVSALGCARDTDAQPPVFATDRGAIGGYDPVAYFDQQAPVLGSSEYAFDWKGARWLFSTAENRERFRSEPERFAPRFGGYCAYGVASGYAVKTEPEAWTVVDGKLYLNYDLEVMEEWRQDQAALIAAANENWPEALNASE